MTMYYAGSTKGFYTPDINPVIPDDAVEITNEHYQDLLSGQSEGKCITADDEGYPTLTDFVILPATADQNKKTASDLLSATDWITVADVASPANNPHLGNQAEFIAYRNTLRAIAVSPPEGDITWATPPSTVWIHEEV